MPTVQDLENAHKVKFGTDDANFGQCTAVADAWEEMLGLPMVYGNAVDVFGNAPVSQYIKTENSETNFPVPGDIIVWHQDPRVGTNAFGHIAVVVAADVNSVIVFEQNDTIGGGDGSPRQHTFVNYAGVTGWLHPRVLDALPPAPAPVVTPPAPTPPVVAAQPAPLPDPTPDPQAPPVDPPVTDPAPVDVPTKPATVEDDLNYFVMDNDVLIGRYSLLYDAYDAYELHVGSGHTLTVHTVAGDDITQELIAEFAVPPKLPTAAAPAVPAKTVVRLPFVDSATYRGILTAAQVAVPWLLVQFTDPSLLHFVNEFAPGLLPFVTGGAGILAFVIGVLRKNVPNY